MNCFSPGREKTLHSPHSAKNRNFCDHFEKAPLVNNDGKCPSRAWYSGASIKAQEIYHAAVPKWTHTLRITGFFSASKETRIVFSFQESKNSRKFSKIQQDRMCFCAPCCVKTTMKYRYIVGFSRIVVARRTIGQTGL